MSELNRDTQLEDIHGQLEFWQENLAKRVAGEAQALDLEIGKLLDSEIDETWETLRNAHKQILTGTDTLRDLRRRLQDRAGVPHI